METLLFFCVSLGNSVIPTAWNIYFTKAERLCINGFMWMLLQFVVTAANVMLLLLLLLQKLLLLLLACVIWGIVRVWYFVLFLSLLVLIYILTTLVSYKLLAVDLMPKPNGARVNPPSFMHYVMVQLVLVCVGVRTL